MNYGKSNTGFAPKPFEVIQSEMFAKLSAHFGKIDQDPDGPFGEIVNVSSVPHTEIWQEIQGMAMAIDATSAEGAQLDVICGLNGISRRPETATYVDAIAKGTHGTVISAGSIVSRASDGVTFVSTSDIAIEQDRAIVADLLLGAGLLVGTTYTISITPQDRAQVDILVVTFETELSKQAIDIALQINEWRVPARLALAVPIGPNVTLVSHSPYSTFVIAIASPFDEIGVEYVHSPIQFVASEVGATIVSPNTLTTIVTSIAGWEAVTNLVSGQTGADTESDENLRRRRLASLVNGGASTPGSIMARVWQNVPGVSLARIFENPSDRYDEYGRAPHTIHPVIEGGDSQEIAQVLADNHAGGIRFHGGLGFPITDSAGNSVDVRFDRVGVLFGHIRVTISDRNSEQVFPANGVEQIRQNIFNYIRGKAELGEDIVSQHYTGTVFLVEGFKQAKIEVAVTGQLGTNPDDGPAGSPITGNASGYSSGWQDIFVGVAPWNRVEWRDSYNRITIVNEL